MDILGDKYTWKKYQDINGMSWSLFDKQDKEVARISEIDEKWYWMMIDDDLKDTNGGVVDAPFKANFGVIIELYKQGRL